MTAPIKVRTRLVNFRVRPAEMLALKRAAKQNGCSVSELVRRIVEHAIEVETRLDSFPASEVPR